MSDVSRALAASITGLAEAYRASAVIEVVKRMQAPDPEEPAPEDNPPEADVAKSDDADEGDDVAIHVPILKAVSELQEVTGVVLTPEVVDGQGDIIGADVVEKAAGDFLAGFNKTTKLGFMHSSFNKKFELRQSFIAPSDMVIANKTVKKGAWIMVVKIKDAAIWKDVKAGKFTGFSIGGKAAVQKLST